MKNKIYLTNRILCVIVSIRYPLNQKFCKNLVSIKDVLADTFWNGVFFVGKITMKRRIKKLKNCLAKRRANKLRKRVINIWICAKNLKFGNSDGFLINLPYIERVTTIRGWSPFIKVYTVDGKFFYSFLRWQDDAIREIIQQYIPYLKKKWNLK